MLSGGEKVRCMLSKMMLSSANVLLLDEPTNHLDLESITAVNDGLASFKGSIIFTSYDFEFINTIANRVIDLNQSGGLSKEVPYEEYLQEIGVLQNNIYTHTHFPITKLGVRFTIILLI